MKTKIGIIDVGIGNVASVSRMLEVIGADTIYINQPEKLNEVRKLILPGVGNFSNAMKRLHDSGFVEALKVYSGIDQNSILGICLGMHLLCNYSEEGNMEGLGLVNANVKHFNKMPNLKRHKIPHMGWNTVKVAKQNIILPSTEEDTRFYFVHSYFVELENKNDAFLYSRYIEEYCSAFIHKNIIGVQFHPEKSHRYGKQLLKNYVEAEYV